MPGGAPPIAIRRALEEGWSAFRRAPLVLMLFTLLLGSLNLLCQLLIRSCAEALAAEPLALVLPAALVQAGQLLGWLGYGITNLWLLVGLLQGAGQLLAGQPLRLRRLLRLPWASLARAAGTLALVLLLLALINRLAQASGWLMALLQPVLAPLPGWAGVAASVYLITDQVLSLPIAVLGELDPLTAVRRGRAAIDPHWLQALGLTLLLGLLVLAGFLLLVVGLAATLPLAACTLVAAYQQLFEPARKPLCVGNRLAR